MHSKYADKVEVTNITSMAIPELDKLIEEWKNREENRAGSAFFERRVALPPLPISLIQKKILLG